MIDVFGAEPDAVAVRDAVADALAAFPEDDPRLNPKDDRVAMFDPGVWLALVMDGRTVLALRDAASCLLQQLGHNDSAQSLLATCEEWLAQAQCPNCGQAFAFCICQ